MVISNEFFLNSVKIFDNLYNNSIYFKLQREAWVQPELSKNQIKYRVVISIEISNVDWTPYHVLYNLNAVNLKEYGCLIETLKPNRSSKSSLLLSPIVLITIKVSKLLRSIGPKYMLAVTLQQSHLKHCQSNSCISVLCRCSFFTQSTCATILDGGDFSNNNVYVIAVAIVHAMHTTKSPILTEVVYNYEKFQYAQSPTYFTNVVNEYWRSVEGRKWFQIWLLYYYSIKTKTRLFLKSSDCLNTIVAADIANTAETTESSDIHNVLVSSPLLSSLSIQAICNVLKMELNIACATLAYRSNDIDTNIDTSLLYDSMSRLNSNQEVLRNKCASFNINQIKQFARSGQINVETYLHSVQPQLLDQAQSGSATNFETITKTPFAQYMNRQLPLPPPITPNSISQKTTTTTESSMSPLSLCSCDFVVTRYSSNQLVVNQTKTTNYYNKNDKGDGDLEDRTGQTNIRERLTRQRFQSKTGFAPLTLLFIDLRKMFITFLLPLILLCKMLPMSCAGEYIIHILYIVFNFFLLKT